MTRILLIKTSSLGDVVHNLPMVSDIQTNLPRARIDWVVEEGFADIPAMHPAITQVIPVATRRWRRGLWRPRAWREAVRFLRQVRAESYDVVLDSQGLLKSAFMARLARGPAYGLDRLSAREPLAARLYDHTFSVPRGRHAVARNRQLAAQVFGYSTPQSPPDYGLRSTDGAQAEESLRITTPYVVCLHGTSRDSKLWPENYWVSLTSSLSARGITPVLPWGAPRERERAEAIARAGGSAIVLSKMTLAQLAGVLRGAQAVGQGSSSPRAPLAQLAGVLRGAQAVVGVDTGLVHLAVALDRPTVAIYTDTLPGLTGVMAADPARAVSLGGKGVIPSPEEVERALENYLYA